jgi:hypothetical protein
MEAGIKLPIDPLETPNVEQVVDSIKNAASPTLPATDIQTTWTHRTAD